jgi:hypothetical protein
MLRIEICLGVVAILSAFAFPRVGSPWFERIESSFSRFAERRALAVVAVGALAVVARLAVLPVLPVPTPAVHDEFSYLLMADTFAHGRLANPTHPMSVHFETFYVNQVPTYVSKYFPAQGIFLATGQAVFGHPFWGVVLGSALMCAAICWMLQGWLPPAWALLGGLLAVVRLGTFSYWANSYWGGAVAAIGGALVLGALPRIKERQRIVDAISMGVGLALLFNSRPYESLFLALPIAIALLVWLFKTDELRIQKSLLRVILPLGITLVLTVAAMGLYFWKTTGHPFQPPYLLYERTHSGVPLFPWVPRAPIPTYSSTTLQNVYEGRLLDQFNFVIQHPLLSTVARVFVFWLFYLGPTLTIPILMLLLALPFGSKASDLSARMQFLLLTAAVSLIGMLLPVYFEVHYAAPITALVYAILVSAMACVRPWFVGTKPVGLAITRGVVTLCVLLALVRISVPISRIALTPPQFRTWATDNYKFPERTAAINLLKSMGGLHLVLAENGTDKNIFDWVYNAADIDASKIVWARDLGPAKNQELIDYYKGRTVWILDPKERLPTLRPYYGLTSVDRVVPSTAADGR